MSKIKITFPDSSSNEYNSGISCLDIVKSISNSLAKKVLVVSYNNNLIDILVSKGLKVVGKSTDKMLVEVIEIDEHPWFIGCQFHPEFTSDPRSGHPLFTGFIKAAKKNKISK